MKKRFIVVVLLLLFTSSIFAQQSAGVVEEPAKTEKQVNPFTQSFFETSSIFLGLTPTVYFTPGDNKSAPSPVVFPFYIGVVWPKDYFISIQPSVKIFSNYYFINDGEVLPAEIENRTANSISFLLNLPVVFKINLWDKANITASAGIALLLRVGFLAGGVNENDSGYYGTAQKDVEVINSAFYEGGKFVYFSTSADWMFNLKNGMQIGPEASFYIPVVTLISEFSMVGTMISVGVKFIF